MLDRGTMNINTTHHDHHTENENKHKEEEVDESVIM